MGEFGTVFCLFFPSVWARPGSKKSGSGFDFAARRASRVQLPLSLRSAGFNDRVGELAGFN